MLDIEPLVTSLEAFGCATAEAERVRLLAQIRNQLQKLQAADDRSLMELERAFAGGAKAEEAGQAVLASREDESAAAKTLIPRILSLQRYLTGTSPNDDPEAHQLLQKAVNVAIEYIAGYQDVRDHLIGLDAEQRESGAKISRARPVEGEIDHAELTREIIRRFPKILAELAK